MLKRLRSALTARATVIALLLLMAASMGVAALVPQAGPRNAAAAPDAAAGGGAAVTAPRGPVVRALGLDHVFSTPWFAALSGLFVVTLVLSTVDQLGLSRVRTRQVPAQAGEGGVPCAGARPEVERRLARAGYRRLSAGPGRSRHVKHWQGYWGNSLLHAGMTVTVLFSVTYVLTEHRAQLHALSGRTLAVVPGGYPEKRGLLAGTIPLPSEVNLYRVEPTFGANDQLVDLASQLIFTDEAGAAREVRVAVNDFQDYRGLVVYQLVKYGLVFYLELRDRSGAASEVALELPVPAKRGEAAYANHPLGGDALLKAKVYASADRKEILPTRPQLVLRLQEGEGGRVAGEVALEEGQEGRLGPVTVRLARVGWWTDILFEGSRGTAGIFTGFGLLLLGAALTFFAVPREVVLRDGPDGLRAWWRTSRFPDMYRAEGEGILALCKGVPPS